MLNLKRYLARDLRKYIKTYVITLILSSISLLGGILAPMLFGKLVDEGIKNRNINFLFWDCLLILGIQLISCIVGYIINIIYGKMKKEYIIDTKIKVLNKIFFYQKEELLEEGIGKILNIIDSDIECIASVITDKILQIIQDIIIAIVVFFILIQYDCEIFFCIMLVQIGLYYINKIFGIKMQKSIKILKKNLDSQKESLHELGKYVEYIIKGGIGSYFLKKFMSQEKIIREDDYNIDKSYMLNSSIGACMSTILTLIILGVGGVKIIAGALTLGELYAIRAYASNFIEPVERLLEANLALKKATVSFQRVYKILAKETIDNKNAINTTVNLVNGIRLTEVRFSYNKGQEVLKQLNLIIYPNKTNVFIGKSGCGKSTIINLLTKFINPIEGTIRIGNQDISLIETETIREKISYMPQEIGIFNDSILNNITLGEKISFEYIVNIAELLGIHKFIMSLDKQYDTIIKPNGSNLSGGQCQKIGILRALVKGTDIVIMDEPTSNLDSVSENLFCNYIFHHLSNRTVILISHDLETVKEADVINIVANGAVIEHGTHKELLERNGEYYNMITQQL